MDNINVRKIKSCNAPDNFVEKVEEIQIELMKVILQWAHENKIENGFMPNLISMCSVEHLSLILLYVENDMEKEQFMPIVDSLLEATRQNAEHFFEKHKTLLKDKDFLDSFR